jgi:hypothetical protein
LFGHEPYNVKEYQMSIQSFAIAPLVAGLLMIAGLAVAVPASAQTTAPQRQKTQEGPDSAFWQEQNGKYKQKTQDSAFWQENNQQTRQRSQPTAVLNPK